jgi:hypothetical protein
MKNTQTISSLTHISEIQEDQMKHLDIEVASNPISYLQFIKLSPAILVSAWQEITFQTNFISDNFLLTI